RAFARRTIAAFEATGADAFVVNAAGCGSAMKEYGPLLDDDPAWAERAARFAERVRDVSELLAELGPSALRRPLPMVAAYHQACHLGHAQGVRTAPRALLRSIPGLELREVPDAELCCGSAGIYNIVEPGPAHELGRRKAEAVTGTGADVIITSNPGCVMQIAAALEDAGRPLPIVHIAEVLDASLRGRPGNELIRPGRTRPSPGSDRPTRG